MLLFLYLAIFGIVIAGIIGFRVWVSHLEDSRDPNRTPIGEYRHYMFRLNKRRHVPSE